MQGVRAEAWRAVLLGSNLLRNYFLRSFSRCGGHGNSGFTGGLQETAAACIAVARVITLALGGTTVALTHVNPAPNLKVVP